MPHTLNIDGISESLFLLQNLRHASRSFCKTHKIKWGEETGCEYQWEYYFGWLKSTLCEHLIKTAITLRMLEDILRNYDQEDIDLETLREEAERSLSFGTFDDDHKKLTLRDAFNKIIHATDTQLDWDEGEDYEWWSGRISLTGKHQGKQWRVAIDVEAYAIAANRFIDALGDQVDWYHLYKYDT